MTEPDNIRHASIITPPPDQCPTCHTPHITPHAWIEEHSNIYGNYQCPQCDHEWVTGWGWANL